MGGFRGSDATLDAEIASVESIVKIRLRRYANDLRELERDLRELRLERAKRRVQAEALTGGTAETADQATS